MPIQPFKQFTFGRDDSSAVVAAMAEIAAAPGTGGWVNIGPALTDEQAAQVPPRSGLAAWFSGRGPAAAMGTWMPSSVGGRPRAAQVGVEHGQGPNALKRLREAGLELPHGWQKRQDHAKHGVVIELGGDVELSAIVEWIIDAVTILTSDTAVEDRFIATVYRSV
ncbi:MAG: hypothetical protein OXN44_02380 [Acidimicrobiaceae bacterium]|nr:hypothetical protein [Acidimicrobiaceae bacterium]MDE0607101.1 hypothetical protein [Acidimicrobiaceae bacterium]